MLYVPCRFYHLTLQKVHCQNQIYLYVTSAIYVYVHIHTILGTGMGAFYSITDRTKDVTVLYS